MYMLYIVHVHVHVLNSYTLYYLYPLVSGSSAGAAALQPGDMVEVCEGSLVNLQGKVLSINGDSVIIMPKHEELTVSII